MHAPGGRNVVGDVHRTPERFEGTEVESSVPYGADALGRTVPIAPGRRPPAEGDQLNAVGGRAGP